VAPNNLATKQISTVEIFMVDGFAKADCIASHRQFWLIKLNQVQKTAESCFFH